MTDHAEHSSSSITPNQSPYYLRPLKVAILHIATLGNALYHIGFHQICYGPHAWNWMIEPQHCHVCLPGHRSITCTRNPKRKRQRNLQFEGWLGMCQINPHINVDHTRHTTHNTTRQSDPSCHRPSHLASLHTSWLTSQPSHASTYGRCSAVSQSGCSIVWLTLDSLDQRSSILDQQAPIDNAEWELNNPLHRHLSSAEMPVTLNSVYSGWLYITLS